MDPNSIIETAARLRALYGMDIRITYCANQKTSTVIGSDTEFWISGGDHTAPAGPKASALGSGVTLAEAEAEFMRKREELSAIDPVKSLRQEAAKEGYDLVPKGRPLDLESSTSREG